LPADDAPRWIKTIAQITHFYPVLIQAWNLRTAGAAWMNPNYSSDILLAFGFIIAASVLDLLFQVMTSHAAHPNFRYQIGAIGLRLGVLKFVKYMLDAHTACYNPQVTSLKLIDELASLNNNTHSALCFGIAWLAITAFLPTAHLRMLQ